MANDLFDDASGADAANVTPTPFSGGSRVIQYGLVSRRAVVVALVALLRRPASPSASAWPRPAGWGLLAIGAVGVVISLAYSAPPLKLVHRGLGEVVDRASASARSRRSAPTTCAPSAARARRCTSSLPSRCSSPSSSTSTRSPTAPATRRSGKRTLPVRWTKERVVAGYAVGAVARRTSSSSPASLLGITPAWTLLALLTVPMARSVSPRPAAPLRPAVRAHARHADQHRPAPAHRPAPRRRLRPPPVAPVNPAKRIFSDISHRSSALCVELL